jgi:AcrR family transcriptional regulator
MAPKLRPETLKKRQTQILRAALSCFARKGYHQATMDDIVQEAGLSKGGVYWHFGSKKELLVAMLEMVGEDMETLFLEAMQDGGGVEAKLRTLFDVFAAFVATGEFQELMPVLIDAWVQNRQDKEINALGLQMYETFRRPIVELIEEGMRSGEFKRIDASTLAGIIIAIYDGLMVQEMIAQELVNWHTVSETLIKTLVAGLLVSESGQAGG